MALVTSLPPSTPHAVTLVPRGLVKGSMTSRGSSWSQSMNPEQGTPFLTLKRKRKGTPLTWHGRDWLSLEDRGSDTPEHDL